MKPISAETFIKLDVAPAPGAVPMLQWIEVALLVVDDSYQRDIRQQGRKSVRKIAEAFSWSKFAPVIVSPVEGGRFAVVDGQHRATAAALLGINAVPCQVIIANAAEQAAAFHAINGSVTKITSLQLHAAALAAGDPDAVAINDVCMRAGCEIVRSMPSAADMKAGQTRCASTIGDCLKIFGRDVIVTALQCVAQTANREAVGLLQTQVIRGLCELLKGDPSLLDVGEQLLTAFDDIDIAAQFDAARHQKKAKGETTATVLARRLKAELQAKSARAA